ncbi:Glycosyltransferase involved in cell wall bisynthesis [Flavobacterium omnivorum]|uniref:Glycosyltransferase involved in cell wall bisynthesis n=1 Tax=Flavobacterium omnivorum TaxID=178355 RepID=A0A1G8CC45_9FLAO|nr:glycosyltransferase family 4 protein [Flavobacterium omnivorum]SDH43061.1 Glycosyltransferase involved in cell wall bisynthesis [Flavobacterium omnivorum]
MQHDNHKIRIIQIIDSLEAGGAERMAVSYANALAETIEFSGLVVTRKEGPLKVEVSNSVSYLFLNKKRAVDFAAVYRLRKFVKRHQVTVIHAHSTSFFISFLLKLSCSNLNLVWHDHYGDSEFLANRPIGALQMAAPFFSGIIAVNQILKDWAEQKLNFKNTIYLPNFPSEENNSTAATILKGILGKRIVCLANLRLQKDHFLLLDVACKLKLCHPEWTFHLVGKDFEDDYSQKIKDLIVAYDLEKNVFLYGTKNDIPFILRQSTIGILTSQSEGLPVALLEYGWYQKPVVVTAVGEIPFLVEHGKNGFLIAAKQESLFYEALVTLIENELLQLEFGQSLYRTVREHHSETAVITQYLNWLQNSYK